MHWNTLTGEQQLVLIAEEDDMEISAVDNGVRRFREQCQRQPLSCWPAARQLMAAALESVVDGIEAARIQAEHGHGMKGCQGWGIPFIVMDPNVLALSTLAALLDALATSDSSSSGVPMATAINTCGQRAEMEWHFMLLKEEAPRLKAVMERRIKKWSRLSIRRARSSMGDLGKRWPAKHRRFAGSKLVEIAIEHSGLFEVKRQWLSRRKSVNKIFLTAAAMQVLQKLNDHLEIMEPMFMPMVVPPNDWSPNNRGGYRVLHRYTPLIIQKSGAPEAPTDHGPILYAALNSLQKTEWRINTLVLDTLQRVWHSGGGWAGLPKPEPETMPHPFPEDGSDDAQAGWKKQAARLHQLNARSVSKRLAFLQTVDIAERLRKRVFYFPYRVDFRGRIYPIPQFLQPQGNDVARGLLTFAKGKRLGEQGYRWLLIQYANCCGVDKVSFDDRVQWGQNKLAICDPQQVLTDPLQMKHLWAGADDPWQALATLIEICRARDSGDPHGYISYLPVSVDGSNSGLQHFSAMLRDAEGARSVNLTPGDRPSDIYAEVARKVKEAVWVDSESGQSADTTIPELAAEWLSQDINRKLCKRGTMTYCYGVTQQGLKDALIADGFVDWAENQHAAVQYIGKKIWQGIRECITGAEQVMEWLRQCATAANKADVLLQWQTPIGFKVLHPYLDAPFTRIKCLSAEVSFKVFNPEAGVIAHRQRQAMPPNFVHSMDACHLMMTVFAGAANGISDWMMIHDSFGTHAANIPLLNTILRDEFVKLYSLDVLDRLRQQVIEQTGIDPGPPPPMGDFQLEEVYDSQYFFS
jgi:DNA-directed RNA polymerase